MPITLTRDHFPRGRKQSSSLLNLVQEDVYHSRPEPARVRLLLKEREASQDLGGIHIDINGTPKAPDVDAGLLLPIGGAGSSARIPLSLDPDPSCRRPCVATLY